MNSGVAKGRARQQHLVRTTKLQKAAGDRNAAFTRQKGRKKPEGAAFSGAAMLLRKRSVPVSVAASVLPLPGKSAQGLTISNRQHTRCVKIGPLRRLAKALLVEYPLKNGFDLSVCLVNASEIASLNESFLHHKGPTDVITFDYSETGAADGGIFGEIFICIDQTVSQARRFRTTWQSEMVRYIVHGLLHLCGYDDRSARSRREMKLAEDRLVRQLARRFDFAELGD